MVRPSDADAPSAAAGRAERFAAWGASLGLVGLVLAQQPGRVLPETKLEVTLDPVRSLGRALSAWDPSAGFGRIQNQAVGYLLPMGPFSAAGRAVGLPAWVTQRLWIGAILVVGFLGARALARALGMHGPGPVVAGLAYTLAPASMATVAFQSAGQLPYAFAPWVLVPLVSGRAATPRQAAARSALAVALMGGVNGTATLAVLPLAAVWFLTRAPGRDRRRLLGWWVAGLAAATLWWGVALLVSIRYGVRFTQFTEQSVITTSTETATDLWRGTGNWLGQLDGTSGRWLPGSWLLVSAPGAVIASSLVALGGALGLARRDAPGRTWLLPAALLGVVAMGAGYAGAGGGPAAGLVQGLLDGPLAAFRNVHKFSAVVRLPLAIGLGHLVASVAGAPAPAATPPAAADPPAGSDPDAEVPVRGPAPTPARSVHAGLAAAAPVLAVLLVLGATFPLLTDQLTAPGAFEEVPAAWRQAAAWVDAHDEGTRTLLLPGAAFAEDTWGRPLDEPWAVLADGSWAVRDLIPLGGGGSTRMLDGLEAAFAGDSLPVGFTQALQRAGIGHLVVRNDLDLTRTRGPSPTTIRRLLATDPDLRRVVTFGPALAPAAPAGAAIDRTADDRRASADLADLDRATLHQIEVYEVPDPADRATAYPLAGSLEVAGGPEAIVSLPPDLVAGRATFLADDVPSGADAPTDPVVVATDTARRRDVDFGSVRDAATPTLTADEASPWAGRTPRDRWPDDDRPPSSLTVARDAAGITLTADPDATATPVAGQPANAFDGDPATAWAPEPDPVGRWVALAFAAPRTIRSVVVAVPTTDGAHVRSIDVRTDRGTAQATIGTDGTATVELPAGATREVRITIASVTRGPAVRPIGLTEVTVDGVRLDRTIVAATGRAPATVAVLDRLDRDRYDLDHGAEEHRLDRVVRLAAGDGYRVEGTAQARPGAALDALLADATPAPTAGSLTVDGTAAVGGRPELGSARAADGDPATAWISAPGTAGPHLDLAWDGPITVERLTITGLASATAPIDHVTVEIGGGTVERALAGSGTITIPPTRTDHLRLTFTTDRSTVQQVGVAEVAIDGLAGRTAPVPDPTAVVDLPCGAGPDLRVDGDEVATSARTTVGALLGTSPIAWAACDPIGVDADTTGTRLADGGSGALRIDRVVVDHGAIAEAPAARTTRVGRWGADDRAVTVGAGDAAVLATTENANAGWEATLDGTVLRAVRVDGWRQGWIVPAGSGGTVHLRFRPNGLHRAGLAVGALTLVGLVVAALAGGRRRRRPDPAAAPGAPILAAGPPAERPWPAWVLAGIAVGLGVLVGGAAVVALPVLLVVPRRSRAVAAVLVGGVVVAATIVLAAGAGATPGHGAFSAAAQWAATGAWLALAVSALPERRRPAFGRRP